MDITALLELHARAVSARDYQQHLVEEYEEALANEVKAEMRKDADV